MQLPFGLLFSNTDLPSIRAKTETAWGAKLGSSLRQRAEQLSTAKDPAGENGCACVSHRAMVLAFCGLVWENEEFLQAAKQCVLEVASLDSWFGENVLRHGATTGNISLALDWGREAFEEEKLQQILDSMIFGSLENADPKAPINNAAQEGSISRRRSMADYLDYRVPHSLHEFGEGTNNWDSVIGSGFMLGCLSAEIAATKHGIALGRRRDHGFDPSKRFGDWYDIAKQRLMSFCVRCFSYKGQYCEGGGYYTYGVGNALKGLEAARRIKGEDLYSTGLRLSPKWQRELYPWTVKEGAQNLNDAYLPGHPGFHVIARLAAENQSPWMQDFFIKLVELSDRDIAGETEVLSLIWADSDLVPEPYDEPGTVFDFGETGDVVCRTGRDPEKDTHLVFRCGKWNAAHTHMDRNGIVLSACGERLLVDAGRASAYKSDEQRAYHTRTIAHNCVLAGPLEDACQSEYAEKASSGQHGYNDHMTWGRILTSKQFTDGSALAVGDASMCYVKTSQALRAVYFDRLGFAVVWDYLRADDACEFWQLWHTDNRDGKAKIDRNGNLVLLIRPKAQLAIVSILPTPQIEERVGWIGANPEGSRYVCLKRDAGEFLTLLFPLKANVDLDCKTSGEQGIQFSAKGKLHQLEPGTDSPGFVLDNKAFDFSLECRGLPGKR